MENKPLVSVLMTAYNREKYIAEAIESVLASTYTNFELIIVDDYSSDNTVVIAKDYEAKDERIKVYINEKNLGDYPNRNRAVSYAKGEFIMFVDSDDKILVEGIEKCVETMQIFPQSSFGMYYEYSKKEPFILKSEDAIREHYFGLPILMIGPGGTIVRRSFLESLIGYPIKYGPANDMYFNLKAACYSPIVLLPFEFMYYRRHEGQEMNNSYDYLYNNYKYMRDALKELPLPITEQGKEWLTNKNKRRFTVNIFKYFIKSFNYRKTKNAIKEANFSIADAFAGIFH